MKSLNAAPSSCVHTVCRSSVFEDVLRLYREESIVKEYPITVEFEGEIAVDEGGVTREMFSAFWDKSYSMQSTLRPT